MKHLSTNMKMNLSNEAQKIAYLHSLIFIRSSNMYKIIFENTVSTNAKIELLGADLKHVSFKFQVYVVLFCIHAVLQFSERHMFYWVICIEPGCVTSDSSMDHSFV